MKPNLLTLGIRIVLWGWKQRARIERKATPEVIGAPLS